MHMWIYQIHVGLYMLSGILLRSSKIGCLLLSKAQPVKNGDNMARFIVMAASTASFEAHPRSGCHCRQWLHMLTSQYLPLDNDTIDHLDSNFHHQLPTFIIFFIMFEILIMYLNCIDRFNLNSFVKLVDRPQTPENQLSSTSADKSRLKEKLKFWLNKRPTRDSLREKGIYKGVAFDSSIVLVVGITNTPKPHYNVAFSVHSEISVVTE